MTNQFFTPVKIFLVSYTNRRWKVFLLFIVVAIICMFVLRNFPGITSWFYEGVLVNIITFAIIDLVWSDYLYNKGELTNKIKYSDFIIQMRNSSRIIRIHSTFSYLIKCNHHPNQEKKAENQGNWHDFKNCMHALYQKKKRPQVQILLLNPSSIIARQRDAERHGGVIPSINTNLISLYDFLRGNSHLKQFLKVRIYNRLPGLQLHQTDSSVSISPFPPTEPASEQKRMLYQEHTDPAKFHIKWFMETWEDANNTIDLFDYMEISLEFLDELNRNLLSQTLKVKYLKALSKEYILALDQDQYELLVETFGSDLSVLKMVHFVNANISHTFFCYIQRNSFQFTGLRMEAFAKYNQTITHFIQLDRPHR